MNIVLETLTGIAGGNCSLKELVATLRQRHRLTDEAATKLVDDALVDDVITLSAGGVVSPAIGGATLKAFAHPWFPGRSSYDADGRPEVGASVNEVLLCRAIQGVCAGPLAARFGADPQRLGTFAARMVNGSNGKDAERLYAYHPPLAMTDGTEPDFDEGPQQGASVYDVLLAHAVHGLGVGPLAGQLADEPEKLGALADKIVVAAYSAWYGEVNED